MMKKLLIILQVVGTLSFLTITDSWGDWPKELQLPSDSLPSDSDDCMKTIESDESSLLSKYNFIELEANLREQQQNRFDQDKNFLVRKGDMLKKWLKDAQLSNLIIFEKIDYKKDFTEREIALKEKNFPRVYNIYLTESVLGTCPLYKALVETITPEELFFKSIHFLEIPPELAKLTINKQIALVGNENGELYSWGSIRYFKCYYCVQKDKRNNIRNDIRMMPYIGEDILIAEKLLEKITRIGNTVSAKVTNIRGINPISSIITDFFEKYFTERKGQLQITGANAQFINLYVKNLRKEVIPQRNYWENLQFSLFIFYKSNGLIDIGCVVDGQYASGLGQLPSDENFSDMEPQYSKQLQAYMGALLVKLQNYLVTGTFEPSDSQDIKGSAK